MSGTGTRRTLGDGDEKAHAALAALRKQVKAWGTVLPTVKPRVLDFGLGDFGHTGLIEFRLAAESESGYAARLLFLFDGQACPRHKHAAGTKTLYVLKGLVRVTCGRRRRYMKEGGVMAVPPRLFHSFSGWGAATLLLEVSAPAVKGPECFANERILDL